MWPTGYCGYAKRDQTAKVNSSQAVEDKIYILNIFRFDSVKKMCRSFNTILPSINKPDREDDNR